MLSPEQNPENPENNDPDVNRTSETTGKHRAVNARSDSNPNEYGNQWRDLADRVRAKVEPVVTATQEWVREVSRPGARSAADLEAGRATPRTRAAQGGVAVAALGVLGIVLSTVTPAQEPSVNEAADTAALSQQAPAGLGDSPAPKSEKSSRSAETKSSAPAVPAQGIDVSNHNGDIDWKKVAAGGQHFAFVLASDGESFTNKKFAEQRDGSENAGLYTGAYHFGRPSGSATGQAQRMLDTIDYQDNGKTLPPVLDLEPDPNSGGCYGKTPAEMEKWTKDFLGTIKDGTGKDGIIYASPSFWSKCMGDTQEFKDNPLWLASYTSKKPEVPGGWQNYTFWQHSEEGSVDGIDGDVDVNKFNGTTEDLKALAEQ